MVTFKSSIAGERDVRAMVRAGEAVVVERVRP